MSVVTEHLEQRGSVFQVIPHRQAYTSVDEARTLGIEIGEVLKTLALRTGSGYALAVIPASHRLDLHLAREALGDSRARLASEEELGRDFPDYELGALPPLGALLEAQVYVDPEVLGHDTVTFAAGTQTKSVKMQTQELFGSGGVHDRVAGQATGPGQRRSGLVGGGQPSRPWQIAGSHRRDGSSRTGGRRPARIFVAGRFGPSLIRLGGRLASGRRPVPRPMTPCGRGSRRQAQLFHQAPSPRRMSWRDR
jgi:Ala-tRNA(Pro) deacylase